MPSAKSHRWRSHVSRRPHPVLARRSARRPGHQGQVLVPGWRHAGAVQGGRARHGRGLGRESELRAGRLAGSAARALRDGARRRSGSAGRGLRLAGAATAGAGAWQSVAAGARPRLPGRARAALSQPCAHHRRGVRRGAQAEHANGGLVREPARGHRRRGGCFCWLPDARCLGGQSGSPSRELGCRVGWARPVAGTQLRPRRGAGAQSFGCGARRAACVP